MAELYLRAGLFVFSVCAALLTVWLGAMWVAWWIMLAYILGFAGAGALPNLLDKLSKISKIGPQ